MNKEMLKGTIDLLILAVLKESDNYGYQISKIITDKSDKTFEIQEATLYLALKRLEKQECVEAYWGEKTHGGKRKYYHITDLGIEQLSTMKDDFQSLATVVKKFM
ncbi:PadR family transcriptional regulator [Companilactobacillus allii]|uniref:PadR family transcriptional regulator n=1 Tax=Companilactobacillus allii TaxID=1847728 RepID=A0A1P8PZY4_9LACO|nr:PadR family transcriptional regulator [Companilactobacillus allii]APX71136.1 PadR family transcriptional regulator [Companilactobacillus allii]USQ68217.1 PadR family transcriptional regulator [Companilactobacillus allii]